MRDEGGGYVEVSYVTVCYALIVLWYQDTEGQTLEVEIFSRELGDKLRKKNDNAIFTGKFKYNFLSVSTLEVYVNDRVVTV